MIRRSSLLLAWLLIASPALAADAAIDFAHDVAPIFERHCIRCHQPSNHQGGLSLATAEDLAKLAYIVPQDPDNSYLVDMVTAAGGASAAMPKEGSPLSKAEIAILRRWIATGADWPQKVVIREARKAAGKDWWSLQPLATGEPPTIPASQAIQQGVDWSRHPLDRFILAKLLERGLRPSPSADKRTLLRRATYDLTGLPPTPDELAAFLADRSPRAFEKVIERLLGSPHYGEHWGRHWLDVIRFGESRGFERNVIIDNLWPFRDYVIRSLNADKRFDRFIQEHVAGDVIGRDDPDVEVGSAFLVAGPYDDVGNADPVAAAQIRADALDEMIRTTSEALLGLTVGCARCHDHKFDPIATRDYYAFYATFAGVQHGERTVSTAQARRARQAETQPLEEQQEKLVASREKIEKLLAKRADELAPVAEKQWIRERASRYGTEERFEPVEARYVRLVVAGSDIEQKQAGDKRPVPKRAEFKLDEFEIWTPSPDVRNVALASAGAKAEGLSEHPKDFPTAYSVEYVIDGEFGRRWHALGDTLTITLAEPTKIDRVFFSSDRERALGEDHPLTVFVGDYCIEVSLDGRAWKEVANSYNRQPPTKLRREARLLKLATTSQDAAKLADLERQITRVDAALACIPELPSWWVGKHMAPPGPFHVFIGGDPQKRGDAVVPASLSVLDARVPGYRLDASASEGDRRLALARWLTAPENPLTPRVLANRVWHYHFGRGIVDTPSDFGYMGGRPSHPELLDFLAARLQAGGWRLKDLHRLMMTSQAYRQASTWQDTPGKVDGDSRLLWRFPPRRLSAEELRDTMLAISNKLDLRLGGPGFRLYEYQRDNVATYVPLDEHGPETYRRAVYHQNARAARVDLMSEFDCPDNAFAAPSRSATTTPLQALTLLNHQFTLDMAAALAKHLSDEFPGDPASQVDFGCTLAYGRSPSNAERAAAVELIGKHGLRAYCRALLNSNELVYVR